MKNQYFGDVGDYGKFGLIRYLINELPYLKFGVNWYLTKNDMRTDGKHINYLNKKEEMRKYDPELYDFLRVCINQNRRSVHEIERSSYLSNTAYFSNKICDDQYYDEDRKRYRHEWYMESISALKNAKFIFLDPDNGIEVKSQPIYGVNGDKYVSYSEIKQYYEAGFSLMIYNHRDRQPHDIYITRFKRILDDLDAMLLFLRFKPYSVRDYLFVLQKQVANEVISVLYDFVHGIWGECFTLHRIE